MLAASIYGPRPVYVELDLVAAKKGAVLNLNCGLALWLSIYACCIKP